MWNTVASHPLEALSSSSAWDDYWETIGTESWLYREQSELYVRKLAAAIPLRPDMRVLDFGCGFGFVAELLADRVGEILVWDAAKNMRCHTAARLALHHNCHPLDLRDPTTAPPLRIDAILVNSVVQYMSRERFAEWLRIWRSWLAPGAAILVSDLVPPNHRVYRDVIDLLRFSFNRGKFQRTLRQILRELGSYGRKRQNAPLASYTTDDLQQLAAGAGLKLDILPGNLTHFVGRTTARFSAQSSAGGVVR